MRLVEIRSYQLKAHTAESFHQLVSEQSVPLLRQWGTDVVAYGISAHEENGYFLIRAYQDRADLQQSQDQSVQLIRSNNDAQANYRQNGGE